MLYHNDKRILRSRRSRMKNVTPGKIIVPVVLSLYLLAPLPVRADEHTEAGGLDSLTSILQGIQDLESDRDPKCQATATRLENFMYGTPLSSAARNEKIRLQKQLIEAVWGAASEHAAQAGRKQVAGTDIAPATARILAVQPAPAGGFMVETTTGEPVSISRRDYEQYASVAYALRAVLTVEQEQLLNPDKRLPALSGDAMTALEKLLNIYTLTTLQLADRQARAADRREISAERFHQAWVQVGSVPKPKDEKAAIQTAAVSRSVPGNGGRSDFKVINSVIRQKIASYEAYNEISMPVFIRNLQVYFARFRWPSTAEAGKAFKDAFTESMVAFVMDTLRLAAQRAQEAGHAFIRCDRSSRAS